MSEIHGMKAHVFLPANAVLSIQSKELEIWKDKNPLASKNRILTADKIYYDGVLKLMNKALEERKLIDSDTKKLETKDDFCIGR